MSESDRERRRKHQIARNEALFREVNESVREVSGGGPTETTEFLCECGDEACTETVELRNEEYESVRVDPLLFVIVRGHEIAEVEDLVSRNERFDVVRKHASESVIARQTDPRA
jgi:hypothetical protein